MKELQDILNVLGNVIIMDAKKNLDKGKKNASYKLYNNMRHQVVQTQSGYELQIIMPDHGLYVIGGRGAGKTPPPVDAIVKWLKDKNLARKFMGVKGNKSAHNPDYTEQLRFIAMKIANKIGKNGIKPFNFLNPTKVIFLGSSLQNVRLQLPKEYLSQIIDGYKKATNKAIEYGVYRELVKMI